MLVLELIYGLPALVLVCFGIWILKRETGDVTRAVGYLLTALGLAILTGIAVISLVYGLPRIL